MYMGGRPHVGKFFFSKIFFFPKCALPPTWMAPPENRPYQKREKSRPNQARALRDFKCFNFKESQGYRGVSFKKLWV